MNRGKSFCVPLTTDPSGVLFGTDKRSRTERGSREQEECFLSTRKVTDDNVVCRVSAYMLQPVRSLK